MTKSELLARVPPLYRLAHAVKYRRYERTHEPMRQKHALLRRCRAPPWTSRPRRNGHVHRRDGVGFSTRVRPIETIELEPRLARLARIRFARTPSVHLHEGDSATVLPVILKSLDRPALFWLDAHPSTDRSARDAPVPLAAELAAIAAHRRRRSCCGRRRPSVAGQSRVSIARRDFVARLSPRSDGGCRRPRAAAVMTDSR